MQVILVLSRPGLNRPVAILLTEPQTLVGGGHVGEVVNEDAVAAAGAAAHEVGAGGGACIQEKD